MFFVLSFPLISQAGQLIYPSKTNKSLSGVTPTTVIQKVLESYHPELSPENFIIKDTRSSLLGTHYYIQQQLNGYEVDGSQFVVTVDENNQIVKAYDSLETVSAKSFFPAVPLISETMAYEAAWKHLGLSAELLNAPQSKITYAQGGILVYKINLSVASPAQHFEVLVNAQNGNVLLVTDAALPRMKRAEVSPTGKKSVGPHKTFNSAFKSLNQKVVFSALKMNAVTVNGTAQVFDPNPVVSLMRSDLADTTEASVFMSAYRIEDLKDISFTNGVYTLTGPKVTLIDFEDPYVAPSTSKDGSWIHERKNVKFNDAMTYLHIDRSVRYLESIGFKANKSIFKKSIEVDANGMNGADNSHFIPYSQRLAFGHGCVDDNEDTDVILHELGHAIHYGINPSWGGGDTGAMGEGFGDYWASTYSLTTDRGQTGNIDWVFKWDGHNSCWPGRKLSAFTPIYDKNKSYTAHATVNGGTTDELWSTPIFQAFVELFNKGVKRADIDRIVLEAHFGLGSGVKIPQMAEAIVKTAKSLYPAKDYDQVFKKHFVKQGILR